MKCQTADQFQFVRAPHGLMQARCQGTCLKIGTGCFCQTILSNDNDNKAESEPKNTVGVTSPRPPIKEQELKTNDQKNVVGDQIVLFANPTRKRKRTSHSSRRHCQKYKNHRPKDLIL